MRIYIKRSSCSSLSWSDWEGPWNLQGEGFLQLIFPNPEKNRRLVSQPKSVELQHLIICKLKFQMSSWSLITLIPESGDQFAYLSLQDENFHVFIILPHRKYLRFTVGQDLYQYWVLFFGASVALRVFTKWENPLVRPPRLSASCLTFFRTLGLKSNKQIYCNSVQMIKFIGVILDSSTLQGLPHSDSWICQLLIRNLERNLKDQHEAIPRHARPMASWTFVILHARLYLWCLQAWLKLVCIPSKHHLDMLLTIPLLVLSEMVEGNVKCLQRGPIQSLYAFSKW